MSAEATRLEEANSRKVDWRKWGPYLSERQWGTVREDYSAGGDAWDYFSHDQARSRAYRWGEDGIAGISDDRQLLCFALAFWNGQDPILKERIFGLTNNEGNHGEDVKEYYFYLDSTPTHSFMRMLYKYPQSAFPYSDLVLSNRARSRDVPEYELIDTGVFDEDRYFDIEVLYAKAGADDILIEVTAHNRGAETARLDILPTLWFRNTWSWQDPTARPALSVQVDKVIAAHEELGAYQLAFDRAVPLLFTENESNNERLFESANASPYVKDSIGAAVVDGREAAVNPLRTGTKMAAHYRFEVEGHGSQTIRLRLGRIADGGKGIGSDFSEIVERRRAEADTFYAALLPASADPQAPLVFRQALAGMLWSKQFYNFDLLTWLREHGIAYPERSDSGSRNAEWSHMINSDVISMPDKWEYPWFAAWDLAFHTVPLALVDPEFAKSQLALMLRADYLHPNGQLPAYEWNFGDVNPPVHAWAVLFIYEVEKQAKGTGDLDFLRNAFRKLLMNFNWWVNRKDPNGRNVFEGGFLGLDNIGVFDRSAPLPTGGRLEQADGTAWMVLFCQSMLEISLVLAEHDPAYEDLALEFVQHFCRIASATNAVGDLGDGMWDDEDGFYYDLIRFPNGGAERLRTRSFVGLLPLCAAVVVEASTLARHPELVGNVRNFLQRHRSLSPLMAPLEREGSHGRRLFAVVDEQRLRRILHLVLDPNEFLGDHGIRAVSRWHHDHPYIFEAGAIKYRLAYEPAESSSGLFGGNSNWRGPVWFPVNVLLVRALRQYYLFYGDDFLIECPTGSGIQKNLYEVSEDIAQRLITTFYRDADGHRPVFGGSKKFQTDPHWRDNLLFYEYFHGDNGAGIGASHQTGWTGLVAALIALYSGTSAPQFLQLGAAGAIATLAGQPLRTTSRAKTI